MTAGLLRARTKTETPCGTIRWIDANYTEVLQNVIPTVTELSELCKNVRSHPTELVLFRNKEKTPREKILQTIRATGAGSLCRVLISD